MNKDKLTEIKEKTMKEKKKRNNLVVNLLELILVKTILMSMLNLVK